MGILLSIVLVLLGALILAFRGFFGSFPDSWQWVGIVLAAVGIMVGVPSIFQMILGRPKLILGFDRIEREAERHLAVYLKNSPISNLSLKKKSFWSKLGVGRETIESLTVSFRINEAGTGRILIPVRQARIYSDAIDEDGTWRTTLPPTLSDETSVMIAMWDNNKKKAIVPPDKTKSPFELGEGVYQIQVIVALDGDPRIYIRQFIVGKNADDLAWVPLVSHK